MDVELAHVKDVDLNIETRRAVPSDEPSVIPPAKFGQTVLRGGIMTVRFSYFAIPPPFLIGVAGDREFHVNRSSDYHRALDSG